MGYRRPDRVYYFNSSGYWSRSSPVLVGRAPSVHLPLARTKTLPLSTEEWSSVCLTRLNPGHCRTRFVKIRQLSGSFGGWTDAGNVNWCVWITFVYDNEFYFKITTMLDVFIKMCTAVFSWQFNFNPMLTSGGYVKRVHTRWDDCKKVSM